MKNVHFNIEGQADFYKPWGKLYTPGAELLIPVTDEFIVLGEQTGKIHATVSTGDWHEFKEYMACTYSDEAKKFDIHCEPGTAGWEHVLTFPEKNFYRLWKKDNSMWHSSATINGRPAQPFIAKNWSPKNWRIVISGVCSDICVAYAIAGFLARGYRVVVLVDLVRGLTQQMPEYANKHFAAQLKTKQLQLMTSKQFLNQRAA